jgi:hypothetical protein
VFQVLPKIDCLLFYRNLKIQSLITHTVSMILTVKDFFRDSTALFRLLYILLVEMICLSEMLLNIYSTMLTLVDLPLDGQNSYLFTYNTFIKILYMFRALPCSSSGGLRRNCIYAASGIVTVCR